MRRVPFLVASLALVAFTQPAYSPDRELALGKQLAAEIERNAAVINDPAITGYVDRTTRKLAATAQLRTPLTVKVISGPNLYTITLPGGFLDISTRLIVEAANEAELAGVIAHQLGHLVLGPASPPQPAAPGAIPLLFMGGGLCVRVPAHAAGVGLAIPTWYLAASRETEAQADELGLDYMQNAGYDPGALADFYGRIPKIMPESTRIKADSMRNGRSFVVTTSEFAEIQRKVADLPR